MACSKLLIPSLSKVWARGARMLSRSSTLNQEDELPSLLTMMNGKKVHPTFTKPEMERRLTNIRNHMVQNEIGGVLFTSYHNVNYYADFLYTSFGRSYGLVITMEDVTSISATVDAGQPWRRTATGDNLVYTDWQKDTYWKAVQKLLGDVQGKIGIEYDDMNMERFAKLGNVLPNREKVDVSGVAMRMRMVKSNEEIALTKEGARIADIGGAAVVEALDVGVGEYEVALHSTQAMVKEIAKSFPHAELMNTWTWVQSGINTDGAHNPVTSRKIEKGDILSLNCFPLIAGYYTALERTLFMDHVPSERHMELWEVNLDVYRRGIELLKPGVRCCDVARELNELYREKGLMSYRTFGYGHSFGVLCHYYGREAGLELREDIETVLEPNMVISMEPMLCIPEGTAGAGGYREHDILVITEKGNENITGFPIGPDHLVIKK